MRARVMLVLLASLLVAAAPAAGRTDAVPVLTTLSPNTTQAGGPGFTLTVIGTNLLATSVVRWNGADRSTTYDSKLGQLWAWIPASDIAAAGSASVTVFTPEPGGGTSNALTFTITPGNPVPVLHSLAPDSATAGDPGFTLTVNGADFLGSSVVRWNGLDRATTFVSAGQLTASIPATDLAAVGTAPVTVFTPGPGGGTSNALTFTIGDLIPVLTALTPSSAIVGGPGFTLTVHGEDFQASSVVQWYGDRGWEDRATTYVGPGQLTAVIPASDIASAGLESVRVSTPGPAGGASNVLTFTVENPMPALASLSPDSATAGDPGFTLTLVGADFRNSSVVRWNGLDRTTTYVNAGQLTALIPAGDLAAPGTANVTVFTPGPGGGTSDAVLFTLDASHPVPALTTLMPSDATAGGPGFTLLLGGAGFRGTSVVRWNDLDRPTTYVNEEQLTASIPATDIAATGTANVTVFTPGPGGGTSDARTFTMSGNPAPVLTVLSPSSTPAAGPGFTLTVIGTNLLATSVVRWNGADRSTTYDDKLGQLWAWIPSSDIAVAGSAIVTVVNPEPGGGTSNALTFTFDNPVPMLTALAPDSATAGAPDFTLTVNGADFLGSSVVRWNGLDRATTYVSAGQLTASIPASDIAAVGTAAVTVFTPGPGGGTSDARTFTVTAIPVPVLSSLAPGSATAGEPGFTLTVNGTGFVGTSVVRWNGSDRTTTYLSREQLTAAITAGDIATPGTASVTVSNPAPGGGTSDALLFSIDAGNPMPVLASLTPSIATVGDPGFTLTLDGAGFRSSSVVRWNGVDRATTYVSEGQLTAMILAGDIANAGTVEVTVSTPAPGGGTSNALRFVVINPVPVLTALAPDRVTAGDPGFTLTVSGADFVAASVVRWNGAARPTTYVNVGQLTALIEGADIAAAGMASVTVFSPMGGTSNALTLAVEAPPPTLTVLSPSSATAGGSAFTLTVGGARFEPTSVVRWKGVNRPTTYMSPVLLSASIPAADIATAGTASVTVFTPAPGGGTSEPLTFTISTPAPVLSSLTPNGALSEGPGFTLTLGGAHFEAASVVRWKGVDRPTTYLNPALLSASIPAADIATAGTANVTVHNPAGGTSNALTFTVSNPAPVSGSMNPISATAGDPGFALTVNGANFRGTSVVRWNGSARVTSHVSAGQLVASIPPEDVALTGTASVTVYTPGPGGGESSPLTFTIDASNPQPALGSLAPSGVVAGTPGFTLTLHGANFRLTSVVRWNGSTRPTTYVNPGELTALIPATDVAVTGTVSVTVSTPAPGGGVSNSLSFMVVNPVPVLTSLTPSGARPGDPPFMLTLDGTGFASTSVVRWNGTDRMTTFVSPGRLLAWIPAGDISAPGTASVTVFTPGPGGGSSSSRTFTISAATDAEVHAPPGAFALYPTAPNPGLPGTAIRYDVPAGGGSVSLRVYDVAGKRVRTLVEGAEPAGQRSVRWDGRDDRGQRVPPGTYFYRMTSRGFVEQRKLVLLQ